MILTTEFANDSEYLARVLQYATTTEQVLTALGVTEVAKMSPFAVHLEGGFAEFSNVKVLRWATSYYEVVPYAQFEYLVAQAKSGPNIPNLGSKALVTYTGTAITAVPNPSDLVTYRLETDLSTPLGIAWKVRPTIGTDIVVPMTIAIGNFLTPPDADLVFANTGLFFSWLTSQVVYEPLTLLFMTGQLHTLRYPISSGSYPSPGSDPVGTLKQEQAMPVNLRRNFRGRGSLIIRSVTNVGEETANALTFTHLSLRNCVLHIQSPILMVRDAAAAHYVLHLQGCTVHVDAPIIVQQSATIDVTGYAQSVLYSTKLHRCELRGSSYIGLTHDPASPLAGAHWGLIQNCKIYDLQLTGYCNADIHQGGFPAINQYRQDYSRFGWRVLNTKWRGVSPFRYSVYEEPGSSTYLRPPMNYTFVNCQMWFNELILGTSVAGTPINVNLCSSFVRAFVVHIADSVMAPTMIKLMDSTLLSSVLRIEHQEDQTQYGTYAVNRASLSVPAWIHLQSSVLGVIARDTQIEALTAPAILGDASVRPSVHLSANSKLLIPATYPAFDPALVTQDGNSHLVIT